MDNMKDEVSDLLKAGRFKPVHLMEICFSTITEYISDISDVILSGRVLECSFTKLLSLQPSMTKEAKLRLQNMQAFSGQTDAEKRCREILQWSVPAH